MKNFQICYRVFQLKHIFPRLRFDSPWREIVGAVSHHSRILPLEIHRAHFVSGISVLTPTQEPPDPGEACEDSTGG